MTVRFAPKSFKLGSNILFHFIPMESLKKETSPYIYMQEEEQRIRPAATSTEQEFVSCSSESDEEMVTDQVPV